MRILVTGGAGFIGSHTVDALVQHGHTVTVVDDLSRGHPDNLNGEARFHKLNVLDPALAVAFAGGRFDYVLHFAAQISVRRSWMNPGEDAHINILGLLNVLDNCISSKVKGVVFASSGGAIYGEPESLPVVESAPKHPQSPYGISKLASEHYLTHFARAGGLHGLSLRFANVYGPRQDPEGEAGVVAIFVDRMMRNEAVTVFGDGTQSRDYIYVEDVASACVRAIHFIESERTRKPSPGLSEIDACAFNIGTGVATTVNNLATIAARITSYQGEVVSCSPQPGEIRHSCLDYSKAARLLGWSPTTDLPTGVLKTVRWLRDRTTRLQEK